MSTLEHVENRNLAINTETVDSTLEPELSLNESEAKEIDSCINFLSILDDDSSNDSCEFTLFRKKYESPSKSLVGEEKKDQEGATIPPKFTKSPSKLKSDKALMSCEIANNTSAFEEFSQDTSSKSCLKTKSPEKSNIKPKTEEKFLANSPTDIKVFPDFNVETKNLLEENLASKQNSSIAKPCIKTEKSASSISPNMKLPLAPQQPSDVISVSPVKVVKSPKGKKDLLLLDKTLELKVSPKKSLELNVSPKKSELSTSIKRFELSTSPRKSFELKVSKKVTSPSFKATGTKAGQNILRISKLSSNSGTELNAGSVLQSANNIVLKVSKVPKSLNLSPRDKLCNKYSEIKIKKLQKLQSTLTFSTKGRTSQNSINKTKLNHSPKFYCEGNSILPEKVPSNGSIVSSSNGSKVSIAEFFHNSSFDLDPVVKSDNEEELQIHLVNEEGIENHSTNKSSIEGTHVCDIGIKNMSIEDAPAPFINTSETSGNDSIIHKPSTKDEQNKCVKSAEINTSKDIKQEADSGSKTNRTSFKIKPKSSKTTSKKSVKTRILAGGGQNKKKKINKVVNLLKHPPPSLDKFEKKNEEKTNRYLPLVRTELPTFLKKLDTQESITPATVPDKSHTPVVSDPNTSEKDAEKMNDKKDLNHSSSQKDDESKSPSLDLTKKSNVSQPDKQSLVRPFKKDETKDENTSLRKTSRNGHLELTEKVSDTQKLSEEKVANLEKLASNQDSKNFPVHSDISQGAENSLPNNMLLSPCVEESPTEVVEFTSERGFTCDINAETPVLSIPDSLFPENVDFNLLIPPIFSESESDNVITETKNETNESKMEESIQEDSVKNTNEDSFESKSSSLVYSYNKFSPLSFTVQNILENTFKYESYPSSSNMARLAKIMEVHWKDVRDWFLARRYLNKKNGIFTRNQVLSACPVCPRFQPAPNEPALVHLLNKDHVQNMIKFIQKDNEIFLKFQKNCESISSVECRTDLLSQETDLSTSSSQERIQTPDPEEDSLITPTSKSSPAKPVGNKSEQLKVSTRVGENEKERKGKLNSFLNPSAKLESGKTIEEVDKTSKELGSCRTDTRIYIGYRCPDCFKIFQSEWMLIRHAISHKQLICSECNETFMREDLLQHHFKEHIIESLDTKLYPMFLCFKCCSLNCICLQENHYIPNVRTKHYLRPQMAKRSKPFISVPYSNVNERLKVTISEFLQEIRKPHNKKPISNNLSTKKKTHKKKDSKEVSPVPTYTNLTTFNCDICESFFFTEDELKEHLTVHRIQARSRDKIESKQEESGGPTRKDTLSPEFRKPSSFLSSLYFCSYCSKGYKREATLCKHLKFECKVLPKSISNMIYNGCAFKVVNIGKGNKYGIKLLKPPSPVKASKPKVKCKSFPEDPPPSDILKKSGKKDATKEGPQNGFIPAEKNSKPVQEENTFPEYLFLCSYCNIPFHSENLLRNHVRESCSSAPRNVKVEVQMHSLLELEQLGKGSHYRKVQRSELFKILTPTKIRSIFDLSTFRFQKRNQRKVKCKFCNQNYMMACLKLHLFKQCKCIPEEVKNILLRHKSLLKYSYIEPSDRERELKVTTPDEKITSDEEFKPNAAPLGRNPSAVEILSTPPQESTELPSNSPTSAKPIMLYDCHLCEEKFKFSKDFILHMSHFHCMNISEESSCKWLVTSKKETDPSGSGILSPSPTKRQSENTVEENLLEHDANLENIAETLVVSSDYSLTKEEQDRLASPVKRGKRRKNSSSLNDQCFKSPKLEDEEILGDLDDNLDNFIETVQLEDHNFNSDAS